MTVITVDQSEGCFLTSTQKSTYLTNRFLFMMIQSYQAQIEIFAKRLNLEDSIFIAARFQIMNCTEKKEELSDFDQFLEVMQILQMEIAFFAYELNIYDKKNIFVNTTCALCHLIGKESERHVISNFYLPIFSKMREEIEAISEKVFLKKN